MLLSPDTDRSRKKYINIVALVSADGFVIINKCMAHKLEDWTVFAYGCHRGAMLAFGGLTDLDNRWIQA